MRLAAAAAVALVLAGCGAAAEPEAGLPPAPPEARATVTADVATPTATPKPRRRASVPVRIQIPALKIDAPLIRLGLDSRGALEVPQDFSVAGWWTGGSRPGEVGPAVIVGHVDSKTGPAVFYDLGRLRKGDAVYVTRRDGRRVRFTVQGSEHYSKDHFPTAHVYGATRRPTLRLITCSGEFDRASGHYVDNTVVFASV